MAYFQVQCTTRKLKASIFTDDGDNNNDNGGDDDDDDDNDSDDGYENGDQDLSQMPCYANSLFALRRPEDLSQMLTHLKLKSIDKTKHSKSP